MDSNCFRFWVDHYNRYNTIIRSYGRPLYSLLYCTSKYDHLFTIRLATILLRLHADHLCYSATHLPHGHHLERKRKKKNNKRKKGGKKKNCACRLYRITPTLRSASPIFSFIQVVTISADVPLISTMMDLVSSHETAPQPL